MKIFKFYLSLFLFLYLFACGGGDKLKQGLGIEKVAPDEFLIERGNALKIPPHYKLIPPGSKSKTEKKENTTDIDLKNILNKETSGNSEIKNTDASSGNLEKQVLDQIK